MAPGAVMVSAGFVHLLGTAIKELDPMDTFPLAPFLCGPFARGFRSRVACAAHPCTLQAHGLQAALCACGHMQFCCCAARLPVVCLRLRLIMHLNLSTSG